MDLILKELTVKNFPSIKRLANKNHLESQYMLGVAYLAGGPVNIDVAMSFDWFKKAADHGHAEAAFRTGMLLKDYRWDSKPDTDPFEYFKLSSQLGSPAGMTALANKWTFDRLKSESKLEFLNIFSFFKTDSSAVDSFNLYKQASELKYAPAFYFLGIHLLKGWGCKSSKNEALKCFEQGAKLNDKDCAYSFYMVSSKLKKDPLFNIEFLLKAADLGHAPSQYEYAEHILQGDIPNTPESQAVAWLRRSAMQLNAKAMSRLAHLYFSGRHCEQNYRESYRWASRAKHLGLNMNGLLSKIWNNLDEADKVYVTSSSYVDDYNEFFKLSNRLFGGAGFQI